MKRRSLLQFISAAPAANLLRAQQPVVPPKPTPVAVEEIPVIESTIPDLAGATVASFFSQAQLQTLRRLSDLILPAMNGTPGAIATHAPEFLDFLIGRSPQDRQKLYCRGLDELDARAKHEYKMPFAELSPSQADKVLSPLRAAWTPDPDSFTSFLHTAKLDVLQATQSSEDWIRVMSKRVRSAGGLGTYWSPID